MLMTSILLGVVTLAGAVGPLALPGGFELEVDLPAETTELGTFHESRAAAGLAQRLVANGTPEDLARGWPRFWTHGSGRA